MSDQQTEFLRKLQSTLLVAGVSFIFLVLSTWVAFYFNTLNNVASNKEDIEVLKRDKANKEAYELTVRSIDRRLTNIESKL